MPVLLRGQERIMVIADPHVLSQSLVEAGSAFDDMMAGQRKMLDISEVAFSALIDTALAYNPSLVLIPGDLTKDAELASHQAVLAQINRLASAGINTLLIPGNHDIGGQAYAYRGAEAIAVENLSDGEWESTYAMVYNQAVSRDSYSHSYVAEPLSGVTVLGIDASHNAGEGSLSSETLEWLLAQADVARAKGNMVIAMCHWQLLEHVDGGGIAVESGRLQDADAIRDQLMAHGVRLVLTGHVHVNSISTYRDTISNSGDSIVEISTGSPITYPCPYRWLTISQDRSSVDVTTENLTSLAMHDNLTDYSYAWMKEHTSLILPALSVRLFDKAAAVLEKKVEDMMQGQAMGAMVINMLKSSLPQTDTEKQALVEKHLASTIVDLYLLHSAANEPEHAEADSLAQAMYAGMDAMVHELTDAVLQYYVPIQELLIAAVQNENKEAIQSLVEDRTHWASTNYSDRTDDLHVLLTICDAHPSTDVEQTLGEEKSGVIYDLLGRPVNGELYHGLYIKDGKKFIK